MISVKEIIKKYNELLLKVKTEDFYKIDLTNRVNCYRCSTCHHITKTKDIDAGVTPFMFTCENCGETATSTFYTDIAHLQEPTIEWYRPSLKQVLKLRKKEDNGMIDHILQGGLDDRKIISESNL